MTSPVSTTSLVAVSCSCSTYRRGLQHHEQRVVVVLELGPLVGVDGVLHRERVQAVPRRDRARARPRSARRGPSQTKPPCSVATRSASSRRHRRLPLAVDVDGAVHDRRPRRPGGSASAGGAPAGRGRRLGGGTGTGMSHRHGRTTARSVHRRTSSAVPARCSGECSVGMRRRRAPVRRCREGRLEPVCAGAEEDAVTAGPAGSSPSRTRSATPTSRSTSSGGISPGSTSPSSASA